MLSIFRKIDYIWENYGFEALVVGSFIFILLYSFYNWLKGKKGTWDNRQFFDYNIGNPRKNLNFNSEKTLPRNSFGDSKGEIECRRVLENLLNKPFNKARPDFLRNEVTGNNFNLELDCFNPELKLAIEYNGVQHYKFTPYFHKNNEHFLNQKYRDYMKRTLCRDGGITLIEVPYTVQNHKIYDFLRLELIKNGFKV
jgi:hypothetical protein